MRGMPGTKPSPSPTSTSKMEGGSGGAARQHRRQRGDRDQAKTDGQCGGQQGSLLSWHHNGRESPGNRFPILPMAKGL